MIRIDQLVRSSRKTIAIIVRPDGQLIVRAPRHASQAQIDQFISEKLEWIHARQAEAQQRQAQRASPRYTTGEMFLYLGQSYPLEIVNHPIKGFSLVDGVFKLSAQAQPRAQAAFTAWYKIQARVVIEELVRFFAGQFHLTYHRVRISSARTRWGSCSTSGTLSFTWRLVMAPPEIIDYVVIHELAHTIEPNHSVRFWQQVGQMLPDYANRRRWLKENGARLALQ
jgi:predicted metal-dependent hydrolase